MMYDVSEVTEFSERSDGTRARSFSVGVVTVTIHALTCDDEASTALARALHASARGVVARWRELERVANAEESAAEARAELRRVTAHIPPPSPQRLLGPGCVRFRDGCIWLLNSRDRGWGAWGVRFETWDDLFRNFAVAITEHGIDDHGAYWIAAPCVHR